MGCERRTALLCSLYKVISGDAKATADQRAAAEALLKMEVKDHESCVHSFDPRYKTPKEGRKWLWFSTLSSFATAEYTNHLRSLLGYQTDRLQIEQAHSGQSQREKALWTKVAGKA